MASPSFLHIADGSIDLSLNPLKKESLKAHIKYSLLFEEKILFTDAQLIDNSNLRALLFEDSEFSELFNSDNLVIALRNVIDIRKNSKEYSPNFIYTPTIGDIVNGFISWDKCYWKDNSNINVKRRYAQTNELDKLVNNASVERYSLVSVGCTYTDDVLDLLKTEEAFKNIGEKFALLIHELVQQKRIEQISEINPKGGIGIAYFKNQLGDELKNRGFSKEWKKHEEFIINFTQAPFLTALPKIFNANPIYGEMHKSHIEVMNGKSKIEIIGKDEIYKTRLMQYETGINLLSIKSIYKLRNSAQYKDFRNSISFFNGSQTSLNNAMYCYETYKGKIDDEILSCFPFLKETKICNREIMRPAQFLFNLPNYAGVTLSSLALFSVDFTGMNPFAFGLGVLGFIGSRFLGDTNEKDRYSKEFNKRKLIEHLQESKPEKIMEEYALNGNSLLDKNNKQGVTHSVLFSSVN